MQNQVDKYIIRSKIHPIFGYVCFGCVFFFCTGISTAIYPLQLLSITVVAEDEVMIVNDG